MIFNRNLSEELNNWAKRKNRKPLILRGARQVGKTTLVIEFGKKFNQFIYLNLEKNEDLQIFEKNDSIKEVLQAIFFIKDMKFDTKNTLLFIDEIQNSSKAIRQLRYFYEEYPELKVISAGSLLETTIDFKTGFPVGRVEYLTLKPLSFSEFLNASNNESLLGKMNESPFPSYMHEKLKQQFLIYTIIGGMPEIIKTYLENHDINALSNIYESLITSYIDDVEKYGKNPREVEIIRHVINNMLVAAGSRITFQKFGGSNYKSTEIKGAMMKLEKAMLLQLLYPTTNTHIPVFPNYRKSPKLQLLDTGLVNYFSGIQKQLLLSKKILDTYEGKIAEHIVGQELFSIKNSPLYQLNFWVRDKKQSDAEIDFIYSYNGLSIPIEVKAGKAGRLRSLFQYMENTSHQIAVRVYSGELKTDDVKTIKGKEFYLLNLPFYLVSKIENHLNNLLESKNIDFI